MSNHYGLLKLAPTRFHTSSEYTACTEHLFLPLVAQYQLPLLEQVVKTNYSKLAAIRDLLSEIKQSAPCVSKEQRDLIRAYVTDCGLLFAQTREHGWRYNMTSYKNPRLQEKEKKFDAFFHKICHSVIQGEDWSDCVLVHFILAENILEQESGSLERVSLFGVQTFQEVLKCIKSKRRELLLASEARGGSANAVDECRELASTWCDKVRIQIGESAPIIPAKQYFQDKVPNITEYELFWYLGDILPQCLGYINDKKYVPRLADAQIESFQQHLDEYNCFELTSWAPAIPYLRRLFTPDIEEWRGIVKNTLDGGHTSEDLYNKFCEVFSKYVEDTTGKNPKNTVQKRKMISKLAGVLCSSAPGENEICLEKPEIIFFLVRSPAKNSIIESEKGYAIEKDLRCAVRVPITRNTFESDKRLFLSILDVCNEWKEVEGYEEWRMIWNELLPRIMKCVQMGAANLLQYGRTTFYLMFEDQEKGRAFDSWAKSSLEGKNPAFNHIICKYFFQDEKRIEKLSLQLEKYFRVITDPLGELCQIFDSSDEEFSEDTPENNVLNSDKDLLEELMENVSNSITWNRVSVSPDSTTIKRIVGTRNENEITKEWVRSKKKMFADIVVEWVVLQNAVYIAMKDLIECICLVLEDEQTNPR